MRQLIFALCALVVCLGVRAQTRLVYSTADDGYLNVREEPSADAYVIDVLYTGGDGARLLGKQGGWYHVDLGGVQGYVSAKYSVAATTPPRVSKLSRTLYYVVIGSFETLDRAKKLTDRLPDAIAGPVYRAVNGDGEVRYRICTSCHRDRQDAQESRQMVQDWIDYEAWVWPVSGFAECVYRPAGTYDERYPIAPLTPASSAER